MGAHGSSDHGAFPCAGETPPLPFNHNVSEGQVFVTVTTVPLPSDVTGRVSTDWPRRPIGKLRDTPTPAACTHGFSALPLAPQLCRTGGKCEDFAGFLAHAPGCLLRLGVASDGHARHPLHSPHFDIDERALTIGARVLARSVIHLSVPDRGP